MTAPQRRIPFDPSILKVSPSIAEIDVRVAVQNNPKLKWLIMPMNAVIIFGREYAEIHQMERVTKAMMKNFKVEGQLISFTIPDEIFRRPPPNTEKLRPLPCYLDGPPHKKRGVKNRDDKIDAELINLGYDPQRFPHRGGHPPKQWISSFMTTVELKLGV